MTVTDETLGRAAMQYDDWQGTVAFDVENTPEVEKFLRTVSKRFRMRLIHRETINIPGFKDLRVIGDITELQDSDPEQIR